VGWDKVIGGNLGRGEGEGWVFNFFLYLKRYLKDRSWVFSFLSFQGIISWVEVRWKGVFFQTWVR